LSCTPANGSPLAPAASMTCTATHTVTQADLDAGHYYNQACVDDGPGGATQACANKDVPAVQNPHLGITKSDNLNPSLYKQVGQVVTYTIVATNDGNVTLAAVTVTDPKVSGLSCTPANGSSLAPGASMTCTATHTITQADLDAGSYLNTACVDDGAGGAVQQCANDTVNGAPRIVIRKVTDPVNTGSFQFTTTGTGYNGFTVNSALGYQNVQYLNPGTYTAKEQQGQLGWVLTGIGGADANHPYDCAVTGSGGSTGSGNLNTQTVTVNLKQGDIVTCVFENTSAGVTRTQGFWATHSPLANAAWFGGTAFGHTFPGVANTAGIGDTQLCGRNIGDLGTLMGAFWSDISKTSKGAKRSQLDQGRMQLLQQLIAAELNASAFGSIPAGGTGQFATWEAAYCGTVTKDISNAQQGAASFNTKGDGSQFTPGTSADSKNARAIANAVFWDTLP
jgi:uncharacterized repeat protein (TIGR01451 family)